MKLAMLNDVDIYWFSGTGNTLRVARAMAEVFRDAGLNVWSGRIEDSDPRAIDPSHTLGIAVTVACQGTYPPVWDFLENLPEVEGTEVFLVDTLAKVSGGIVGPMRDILTAKGYRPIGAKEIRMPNNFLQKSPDPQKNQQVLDAGLDEARGFARKLIEDRADWRGNTGLQRFVNWTARWKLTWKFARWISPIRIDAERCTKCGLCAELCPVGNIEQTPIGPVLSNRCIACQRCFAFCPAGAVHVGKPGKYAPYRAVPVRDIRG